MNPDGGASDVSPNSGSSARQTTTQAEKKMFLLKLKNKQKQKKQPTVPRWNSRTATWRSADSPQLMRFYPPWNMNVNVKCCSFVDLLPLFLNIQEKIVTEWLGEKILRLEIGYAVQGPSSGGL